MSTHKVTKHFSLGSLKFEPQQVVSVQRSGRGYTVILEKNNVHNDSVHLSEKAFENYVKMGWFQEN